MKGFFVIDIDPVSYTHLDVYKRQPNTQLKNTYLVSVRLQVSSATNNETAHCGLCKTHKQLNVLDYLVPLSIYSKDRHQYLPLFNK